MIKINQHTLHNGLRVVHSQDNSTQMVTLNILYDVGARDENPLRTGIAHLLEHLMFEGSLHIPEFDAPIQQAGGENNAFTNNDFTNFYITLPKQNIETAFWIESDRMCNLTLSEEKLAVQRQVVMEEFKQRNLNQPYGDVSSIMRSMAYRKHPYRWSTIGRKLTHIESVSLDEVKDFYQQFYMPNNAILTVVGNISLEETLSFATKWFGDIKAGAMNSRALPKEPVQKKPRNKTVQRNVPNNGLYMAFQMCDRLHPDYEVCDLISDVLANGYSGRFKQRLVRKNHLFNELDAYISGSRDNGLFWISGQLHSDVSFDIAELAVWNELEQLIAHTLSQRELEKVKNRFESEQLFSNMNCQNLAANLAYYELIDNANNINNAVQSYRTITAQQVQQVAKQLFSPSNCSTLYYKQKN